MKQSDSKIDKAPPPEDIGTAPQHVEDRTRGRIACCRFCGTAQWVPEPAAHQQDYCVRCGARIEQVADLMRSNRIAARCALIGLLLLVPAMSWPMLTVEQFLEYKEAGLVKAVAELIRFREYFLASVIGIASILFPVLKLGFLLVLTSPWAIAGPHSPRSFSVLRAMAWVVEKTGRWGMLEVFLVCVMVFAFRLSNVFHVDWKIGTAVFTLMVLLTMVSGEHFRSAVFGEVHGEQRQPKAAGA
jgi:paraquat-inducible protein A